MKERISLLVADNKLQNVKITDQNFVECAFDEEKN